MPERARYGRRDALLAIAGAAALTGCGGMPATRTDTDSSTDSPPSVGPETPSPTASASPPASASLAVGEQFVTDAGRTVAVAEPAARRMVVDWELTDPPVRAPDGVGFLLATASTTADAYAGVAAGERQLGLYTPTHTPFSPVAEGEGPQARYLNLAVAVDGARNPAGEPFWAGRTVSGADVRRWAFPVPAEPDPSSVEVVWRRRRGASVSWSVPPDLLPSLGALPEFSVADVDAPDAVEAGTERVEVTFSVDNDGERDGTFLAFLGLEDGGYPELVSVEVPVGGSRTVARQVAIRTDEPSTVVLESADLRLAHTVEISG